MTTERGCSTLPQECRDTLATAYNEYQASLRKAEKTRLRAARHVARLFVTAQRQGWPYWALGEACGISGTSAARIVARHGEGATAVRNAKFPPYNGEGRRPEAKVKEPRKTMIRRENARVLTADEKQELAELAALARTCTGSRKLDHPSRIASVKFSKKIMEYHDDGVTWAIIAEASGMKVSGVRMRATRHGYNSGPPPSIPPYQNIVRQGQPKDEDAEKSAPAPAKARKATARRVKAKKATSASKSKTKVTATA